MIPLLKPYLAPNTPKHVGQVLQTGKLMGGGEYTLKCCHWLQERYGFPKVLLTASCTDALEMSALLCNLGPGDEVILPSYTFVSTANPFALRGATLKFADSEANSPHIDPVEIERLISPKTKAIVVVHYGGIACQIDQISNLAKKHGILLVEDAAHAIDSYFDGKPLGTFGDLATFSFHETKNLNCGEGGILVVNNPDLKERSEIIWEKGTNRKLQYRGFVDKFRWRDLGSSFLASDLTAACLYPQLEHLDISQKMRTKVWDSYQEHFYSVHLRDRATQNGHLYYLVLEDPKQQDVVKNYLANQGIQTAFHYVPLHSSPYFKPQYQGPELKNAERFGSSLLRLPLYTGMTESEISQIITHTREALKQ